jgi:hypothetical protein
LQPLSVQRPGTPSVQAPAAPAPISVGPAPTSSALGRSSGVYVEFPAHEPGEVWTLRGRGGEHLCTLPCVAWLEVMSGAYLQRERPRAEVQIPGALPHRLALTCAPSSTPNAVSRRCRSGRSTCWVPPPCS